MDLNKYENFIFDLDGTVLSTVEDIADAVNFSLEKHNLQKCTYLDIQSYLGDGSLKLIKRAMKEQHQEIFKDVFDQYYEYYMKNFCIKTKPYDDLIEVLKSAKNKGIKLFVYTNKPNEIAKILIEKTYPENLFEKVIGIPLNEKRVKPQADLFLQETKSYNINYDKTAYFGDSVVDIQTGKNLKVKTVVSVTWGYQSKEKLQNYPLQPDVYIDEPDDLKKFY